MRSSLEGVGCQAAVVAAIEAQRLDRLALLYTSIDDYAPMVVERAAKSLVAVRDTAALIEVCYALSPLNSDCVRTTAAAPGFVAGWGGR